MKRVAFAVGIVSFGGSEVVSVSAMPEDPVPGTADWMVALLIGGPLIFLGVCVILAVVGTLIAMLRFPR